MTKVSAADYYRMPKLYQFDDFDKCLATFNAEALYCVANSFIKPDSGSELYRLIKDYSEDKKQHLRHDKLQRGLCISSCEEAVRKLGNDSEKYYVEQFPMDSKVSESRFLFEKACHKRKLVILVV